MIGKLLIGALSALGVVGAAIAAKKTSDHSRKSLDHSIKFNEELQPVFESYSLKPIIDIRSNIEQLCKNFADQVSAISLKIFFQESSSNYCDINQLTSDYKHKELLNRYKSQLEIGEKIFKEYNEKIQQCIKKYQDKPFKTWEHCDKIMTRDAIMITDLIYTAATVPLYTESKYDDLSEKYLFEEERVEKITSDMESFWSQF